MAEAKQITFSYKELAEILVKQQGIHEGLWGVFLRFGIRGANIGHTPEELLPAAVVPVIEIGIQKFDEPSRLTVDAAVVNPARSKQTRRSSRRSEEAKKIETKS